MSWAEEKVRELVPDETLMQYWSDLVERAIRETVAKCLEVVVAEQPEGQPEHYSIADVAYRRAIHDAAYAIRKLL